MVEERVELPPRPPPRHELGPRLPWRTLGAVFAPAAGCAAAVGLQRWIEGPLPSGDALSRWLWTASAASFIAAAAVGLLISKRRAVRALWLAWGAAAPWAIALGTVALADGVRPVRDRVAAFRQERCRAGGGRACSAREFADKCRAQDAVKLLGQPAQTLCGDGGCTHRYRYEGPWTPDDYVAPGVLTCSVVVDGQDAPVRYALAPGAAASP